MAATPHRTAKSDGAAPGANRRKPVRWLFDLGEHLVAALAAGDLRELVVAELGLALADSLGGTLLGRRRLGVRLGALRHFNLLGCVGYTGDPHGYWFRRRRGC